MVKKRVLYAIIAIAVVTAAVSMVKNTKSAANLSIVEYNGPVEYDELPKDCLAILSDDFAVCKAVVDLEPNSTMQYPKQKESLYLYNIKTRSKENISNSPEGYVSLGHILSNDNLFWIEQYVNRENVISGKWEIKKYNIKSKYLTTIDSGKFDNFQKYSYDDINFSDKNMLFPMNLDIANNKMVYNRVSDDGSNLNFEIVLYDIQSSESKVIATGKNHVSEYYYDVAVSDKYVLYNKYHEKNDDKQLRATTYKYCDLYAYDIENGKTKQISENDFFINLDLNNDYFLAVRVPGTDKNKPQTGFAKMQVYMIEIKTSLGGDVVNYKSPIYQNKEDLNIGNPTFTGNYIAWQDYGATTHMHIYNYAKKYFVKIPEANSEGSFSIVGANDDNLLVSELTKEDAYKLYRVKIE